MGFQPRISTRVCAAALAVASSAACDRIGLFPSPLADLESVESPGIDDAPYPTLLDARLAGDALGPPPSAEIGAAAVDALSVEAAAMQAESERLSPPIFDVDALESDAADARRGAP